MLFLKLCPVSYNTPYEKIGDEVRSLADEVPFDIPDSWEWVRLGELFQHNTGKALNAANRTGQLKQYITTSNLYWDRFELDNLKEMYFSESEIEKCTVIKGDLLVCEGGDIGRASIWSYDIRCASRTTFTDLERMCRFVLVSFIICLTYTNTLAG